MTACIFVFVSLKEKAIQHLKIHCCEVPFHLDNSILGSGGGCGKG